MDSEWVNDTSFVEVLAAHALTMGRRPFVVDPNRSYTFEEIAHWSSRVALALQSAKVGLGDRVVVALPNRVEAVVATVAVSLLGAVSVPLNVRLRPEEFRSAFDALKPKAVVFMQQFLTNNIEERIRQALGASDSPGSTVGFRVGADEATWDEAPWGDPFPDLPSAEEDVRSIEAVSLQDMESFICYWTSGTTGRPKGVLHGPSILENVWNWTSLLGYTSYDIIVATRPFYYISGSAWALFGALIHGCTLVLSDTLRPADLLERMVAHGATILLGGPSLYVQLMDLEILPQYRERLRLEKGFFGGEPIREGFVRRMQKELGLRRVVQVYGMTELQGFASSTDPDDPIEVTESTVGRPLPGFDFSLRDVDGHIVLAPGTSAELWVRGRVLRGYVTDDGIEPAVDDDGWFHTGDELLLREDGRWEYKGRLKDVAKVKGESVGLSQIDDAVGTMAGVNRAVAFIIDNDESGDIVGVAVELQNEVSIEPEEVIRHCREHLAPYKVPRSVFVLPRGTRWPTTVSGKVVRGKVKAWLQSAQGSSSSRANEQ